MISNGSCLPPSTNPLTLPCSPFTTSLSLESSQQQVSVQNEHSTMLMPHSVPMVESQVCSSSPTLYLPTPSPLSVTYQLLMPDTLVMGSWHRGSMSLLTPNALSPSSRTYWPNLDMQDKHKAPSSLDIPMVDNEGGPLSSPSSVNNTSDTSPSMYNAHTISPLAQPPDHYKYLGSLHACPPTPFFLKQPCSSLLPPCCQPILNHDSADFDFNFEFFF